MCQDTVYKDHRFATLGNPRRVWAISSIHADVDRLIKLHDALYERFKPGDRIVYMGNIIGHGSSPLETLDEILTFRRLILALPNVMADDIVYLRGGQEELWQKVTQVQFAPDPYNTLSWMFEKGLASTLEGYGLNCREGLQATREGVMRLTRWTEQVRKIMRQYDGHLQLGSALRRAAYTEGDPACLFVNAGINIRQPLHEQGDQFWWSGHDFLDIHEAYEPFSRVIRGYDPNHKGVYLNGVTSTLDGGCGFGGALVCAELESSGEARGFIEQ